jgi:urea transport system ATP-binding protein
MLEVNNINLHYGAAQALRGVSLKAEVGKVTCVLGRNGVGKTSLLRAIVGQEPVSAGSISLGGTDITKLATVDRARSGVAFVPQGREIFPLLTVAENLETGFAPLKRDQRTVPDDVFTLFPVLRSMLGRRGGDLDEPTEGIQPSIIKDIGRAISYLRSLKEMSIVLVEQYLDFAQELGDQLIVMDRGSIVYQCDKANMDEAAIKRALAI